MNDFNSNITALVASVNEKLGIATNVNSVQACIESMGVRSKDVHDDFGFKDISELSSFIFKKNQEQLPLVLSQKGVSALTKTFVWSDYFFLKNKLFFANYSKGLFHILPVLTQILTILLFGYSLWAYLGFNNLQSTAVVLGVIFGLIYSGGYVQVIGRQATFYWNFKEYHKAAYIINQSNRSALKNLLKVLAVGFLINLFTHILPPFLYLITASYTLLISSILIVLAPFHVIKKRWVINFVLGIPTLFSLLFLNYDIPVYYIHWSGIIMACIIGRVYVWNYFRRITTTDLNFKSPLKESMIHKNYLYFTYGILLYLFIFLDRIIAWSLYNKSSNQVIYYEKDYEIGMDIAIIIFFLLAGVLEFSVSYFSKFMDIRQKIISFKNRQQFNLKFRNMYVLHSTILLLSSACIAYFIYWFMFNEQGYNTIFEVPIEQKSIKVAIIGAMGYLFLTWAMLNALYMFTLNKVKVVLQYMAIATALNLVIGYFASRLISYEYASIGMLMGSLLFCVLTVREIFKFLRKLDYHYYAAY